MAARQKEKRAGDELADLYPAPRTIAVKVRQGPDAMVFDDDELCVAEMDIRQIAQATRALSAVVPAITPTSSFLVIAAEHPDEMFTALGIAVRWPSARVALLAGGSFARVAAAVWEMNQDFFVQLLALLASGSSAMATPIDGAGAMRSDISSIGDTPTQAGTH